MERLICWVQTLEHRGAAADVGNLVITRTTTNAGAITPVFPGGQSIRTVWNIIPSNVSASRASVQYRYLNIGTNINGQNPASIYGYRYVGGTWNKISASLNSIWWVMFIQQMPLVYRASHLGH
jgi:hypothetical protein